MFEGKIEVVKGFQTSVNIAYDINNDLKVRSFIPTNSALDVVEDVLLSTSPKATQRARMLIGAYGRGKSHLILVLMSLLYKKDMTLFTRLTEKMGLYNPELRQFAMEYIESNKKLLPVIVSGSSSSLTQSFLSALQKSLKMNELDDLMPETHFIAAVNVVNNWQENYSSTYEKFIDALGEPVDEFIYALQEFDSGAYEKFLSLYPSLTAGSTFNPFLGFDVVELYENVINELKVKGFDGLFVIYDEFSKYLEASINQASISDIKMLQDFAEKCDRSGDKQMHLMLISHKDIANYIDEKLPKEKVDGWRGVSGRFEHLHIQNNYSQSYEIISAVIKKEEKFWDKFRKDHATEFSNLEERFSSDGLFDSSDQETLNSVIFGCYPLHPVSTIILPRLSERIAQNERTLFTFLSSEQKFTLAEFLKKTTDEFPLVTPDYLYDYFEPLFRKEPYTSETYSIYKLTNMVLKNLDAASLEVRIVKTVSLIYMIQEFDKIAPTYNTIVDTFFDSVEDIKVIRDTLEKLIEEDCLVYLKRSNGYLKLKEKSGADIRSEITKFVEKAKNNVLIKQILNETGYINYLYPNKYNDENEITRFFEMKFIDSREIFERPNWEMKIENNDADGIVYAIIPRSENEIGLIESELLEEEHKHDRIVFIVPKDYSEIKKIGYEYYAVKELQSLVEEDELLFDEYDIYREDLEEVMRDFINAYVRPENNQTVYYYQGTKKQILRRSKLSALLSEICTKTFDRTPLINNESINKNHLTSAAVNSRTKLIRSLLKESYEKNLGLNGTGQEVSFMRSTLVRTGILENLGSNPLVNMSGNTEEIRYLLATINQFFLSAGESKKCFNELYDMLTKPSYGLGLKLGIIPVYVSLVINMYKNNLVILHNKEEVKLTADLINSISKNPSEFHAVLENWNEEKGLYVKGLEELFSEFTNQNERQFNSFTYITAAMTRWYMGLPKYAKNLECYFYGSQCDVSKTWIDSSQKRFINGVKTAHMNSREFLFEKTFTIFKYKEFNLEVLQKIESIKMKYDNLIPELCVSLSNELKFIFRSGNSTDSSLISVLRDWQDGLKVETMNHIFNNYENQVFDLINNASNNETQFIQKLGRLLTSLRMEDWNQATIDMFLQEVEKVKSIVEEYDNNEEKESVSSEVYKIAFVDHMGSEVIKSFGKAEYGSKAKLLRNEIMNSIDEMGQSITDQEKRQVLMELIEKMI
jgi:hypothetical protein